MGFFRGENWSKLAVFDLAQIILVFLPEIVIFGSEPLEDIIIEYTRPYTCILGW